MASDPAPVTAACPGTPRAAKLRAIMETKRIVVLGAGRVGSAITRDLARDPSYRVRVADAMPAALAQFADASGVETKQADLRDAGELRAAIADADIVVGAVPGPMGFETVRTAIEEGKPIVDISFFEEDAFELDALARERGVVALVDCGVAPGCSNLILGRFDRELDETERFWCVVGGLPRVRQWPYEYKAPFSPIDVIAEYTRPARFRRNGTDVTMPALSEVELIDFPGIGTLEAFNTDGLRTLLRTAQTPSMVEKTMRYPGHAELMRILRDSGFFAEEKLKNGVSPLDMTAALLFDAWRYEPGEEDVTVMRVEVEGRTGDVRVRHTYDLIDVYDAATTTSSMARTTGYTCTAMVKLVASGRWQQAGIAPPEYVGRDRGCFDFVLQHLAERGVNFRHTIAEL